MEPVQRPQPADWHADYQTVARVSGETYRDA